MTRIGQPLNTPTLKTKVITATRDMTAATGNVAYTGVGFVPTSIIAIANIDASLRSCWGVVDSALTEKSTHNDYDGFFYQNTGSLIILETANGQYQYCTVASFDADGFTLAWTKAGSPTGTAKLTFLCFG